MLRLHICAINQAWGFSYLKRDLESPIRKKNAGTMLELVNTFLLKIFLLLNACPILNSR